MRRILIPLLGSILLAGCEIDEVAAPPLADVVIVDAVLQAGLPAQTLLLHRSVDGRTVRGERGASVVVTRDDGRSAQFLETSPSNCLSQPVGQVDATIEATCYSADDPDFSFVRPGRTYELNISTTSGEEMRGRTTLPAEFAFTSPTVRSSEQTFGAACSLPDRPFALSWTQATGAWAYVITLRIYDWPEEIPDLPEPFDLTSVSVSSSDTTLVFPINVGLFQRGDIDNRVFTRLREGLPSDAPADFVVAAADPNYTNAIRGGRFNPSGNVRISSIVGDGEGVFGSVTAQRIYSRSEFPVCQGAAPPTAG